MLRIGIDCDGVLSDFNSSFIKLAKDILDFDMPPASDTYPNTWNYPEAAGMTRDQADKLWSEIKQSKSYWQNLAPYEGVAQFIRKITWDCSNLYFITNRAGETAKRQTERWLLKFPVFNPVSVLISAKKGDCAAALELDFYIDDNVENCKDVVAKSPKTLCYMLARPWNHEVEGVVRVNSLNEFIAAVEGAK